MTEVEKLALWIESTRFEEISDEAIDQLKIRVLDSLGVALGALAAEPIQKIRLLTSEFGGNRLATLIGGRQKESGFSSPDNAAFLNGALIRYLDFNDSYLAPGETCHPSDNIAPVLAAAEYSGSSGREFLTALAIAYQVQILLSENAPVRARGFDHVTQGAYSVAAGASKALRLDRARIANAIAMSGTANNALRVTRTGNLSHWKGLAYPHVAFSGVHCVFLAAHGITGPLEVFEGNKGFKQTISGPFELDWGKESFDRIRRTILKKYNAEIHSQSTIESALELKERHSINPSEIDRVEVDTFQVAYDIIGGGEEGTKTSIRTKEEADHSLLYLVAVALIDNGVMPSQFDPERILRDDVQSLLRRVRVKPDPLLSARFPREMPVRVRIILKDGRTFENEKSDYEGFFTRPMRWDRAEEKFHALAGPFSSKSERNALIQAIRGLEKTPVRDLTSLLLDLSPEKISKRSA